MAQERPSLAGLFIYPPPSLQFASCMTHVVVTSGRVAGMPILLRKACLSAEQERPATLARRSHHRLTRLPGV